jgi:HAD superfamily hydrolase (TIGR01459 family)
MDAIVTSGEAAWQGYRQSKAGFDHYGTKAALLCWVDQESFAIGLEDRLTLVPIDQADFVVLQGVTLYRDGTQERELTFPADHVPLLEQALARQLPLLCINPDKIVIKPNGLIATCPGSVAELYEQMGGTVHYVGKPPPLVYQLTLEALKDVAPTRILAVGDSLHHDIAGALAAGIDCAFVTGGVHAHELGIEAGQGLTAPDAAVESLCDTVLGTGQRPTYVMDACT